MTAVALLAALDYRALGFALLPLAPGTKRPHVDLLNTVYGRSAWSPLRDRPASVPEIEAWFREDPATGVGIITGQASGGLVVVDVDQRKVPSELRHPPTPIVWTPRGWHIYLSASAVVAGRKLSFGDLKAEGGYVVAPPSVRRDGTAYEWVISPNEAQLAPFEISSLGGDIVQVPRGIDISASGAHREVMTGGSLGSLSAAVERMLPVLGIGGPIGKPFRCVLPGHRDRHASASIDPASLRYRDWHAVDGREWYSLAEVFASQRTGRVVKLAGPSASRWWDRLAYEAGLLRIDWLRPYLATAATPSIVAVADGASLLQAIRDRHDPGEPFPFGRAFAVIWCSTVVHRLSEDQARTAIDWLIQRGVFEDHGRITVAGGRSTRAIRVRTESRQQARLTSQRADAATHDRSDIAHSAGAGRAGATWSEALGDSGRGSSSKGSGLRG